MKYETLVKKAEAAKKNSFSPYSKFRVGAALLDSQGRIYTGCNIENSSFSLTVCAERVTLFKAVSEGKKQFKAMAITSDSEQLITPCGACRQVMFDLAPNIDVILTTSKGRTSIVKLRTLLPKPFVFKKKKKR
jgi:cytidine deaminase